MRTIVNIFIALVFTGILVLFAWPLVQKVVKKRQAASTAQTTSSTASVPETSTQNPTTTTATAVPDQSGKLDQQQTPDTAIIPVPKKTIAPSLLGFLHREINSKELDIIKSMACLTTVNIGDAEWRANNLAPFLMAKMIVMQDVLDSIRAHQRFTKGDSFDIFTRYLNDHYDEMMPRSVSKKKIIKKNKKK